MAKYDNKQFDTPKLKEAIQAYLKGNYETAYNMFCGLAFENNGRAMYFLGKFFDGIEGVNVVEPKDEISGKWYKLGASRGDALATLINYLIPGNIAYFKRLGDSAQIDFKDCFEAVKTMAIEGDAFAQMEIYEAYCGLRMYHYCIEGDDKEAFKWLCKAAESGNPDGMFVLGRCYDRDWHITSTKNPFHVENDFEKACRWYQKAAELNNSRAMSYLGELYSKGRGVQQNHNEAFKWYMKAAGLGDPEAMLNLGVAYEEGLGVEKNYGEAFRWYQKASEPEYCKSEAETKLEELLNKF
jgi:hypothetical protein